MVAWSIRRGAAEQNVRVMGIGQSTPSDTGGFAATAFFSKTYDETLALLREARDYLQMMELARWSRWAVGLLHTLETTRLTTRLTHIMAWLLAQKALAAREITAEEARSETYCLGGQSVCLDAGAENSSALPDQLRALLQRSRALYLRISRLEEMVTRDLG